MEKLILALAILTSPLGDKTDIASYEFLYPEIKAAAMIIGVYDQSALDNSFLMYERYYFTSSYFVEGFKGIHYYSYRLPRSPHLDWGKNWKRNWDVEYTCTVRHIEQLSGLARMGIFGKFETDRIKEKIETLKKELEVFRILWFFNQPNYDRETPKYQRQVMLYRLRELIGPKRFYDGYLYQSGP